jgi:hypothetical protein
MTAHWLTLVDPAGLCTEVHRAIDQGYDLARGRTVRAILIYARDGTHPPDEPRVAAQWARGAVEELCTVLCRCPADRLAPRPTATGAPLRVLLARVPGDVGRVLRAARTRAWLVGDGDEADALGPCPVGTDLADLAGVSLRTLRTRVADGTLVTDPEGGITPASARAWLASLGVPGFDAPAPTEAP